jgi:hypothetical protein
MRLLFGNAIQAALLGIEPAHLRDSHGGEATLAIRWNVHVFILAALTANVNRSLFLSLFDCHELLALGAEDHFVGMMEPDLCNVGLPLKQAE